MADDDAYPQDDVGARVALLAYLEGELVLDEAVAKYVSCFPPVADMDPERVRRTWAGWPAGRKRDMANHIRRGMAGLNQAEP